ncbi:toprim domain-containing protein [Sulfurospirillum arcachonense]|uniref:toprim domain-containing protein n=1 Tax=Sulfurospirillum arcachonense TaxID=57666 RepID=UPI000467F606|nr:toprim domain-containing protein [Sulfurospirillum arcachonense]
MKNLNTTSFNGRMKEDAIKAFRELVKMLPNLKDVVNAYDNDEKGDYYHDKTLKLLSRRKDLKTTRDKSYLKDWNDETKAHKIITNAKVLEKGRNLKEEISKVLDEKIKLYNRINQLSNWINPSKEQIQKLEQIRTYQKSLEKEKANPKSSNNTLNLISLELMILHLTRQDLQKEEFKNEKSN